MVYNYATIVYLQYFITYTVWYDKHDETNSPFVYLSIQIWKHEDSVDWLDMLKFKKYIYISNGQLEWVFQSPKFLKEKIL